MDELTTETEALSEARRPNPGSKQQSILVVEDDNSTRLSLAAAITNAGYRVLEAARLIDARKLLAQEQPDLIIVDGLLPDGTGLDFITELRGRGTPSQIIFLSSFFRDHRTFIELRGPLSVGEVLYKPVTPQKLTQAVSRLLAAVRREVRI